jgi:DNA replication initiation complex subunit (GINS family)
MLKTRVIIQVRVLKAEDVVTLPGKNADVLIDRNIAKDVMKGTQS